MSTTVFAYGAEQGLVVREIQRLNCAAFVVAGGIQRLGANDALFGALKRPV